MTFSSPGSTLISIGPLTIKYYGALIALAFVTALELAKFLQKKRKNNFNDPEDLSNFAFVAMISGIIGARTWFCFLNLDYFSNHLIEIPQLWLGGISIQGGLVGGALGSFLYCRNIEKYSYFLSLLASTIPLAQAIGRWGNFFNEEAFGSVTDLAWKLYISHTNNFHHPTFLYESLWNILVFIILLKLSLSYAKAGYLKKQNTNLIGYYLILYSVGRSLIEPLRTDSLMLWGFPSATLLAALGVFIGILLVRNSGHCNDN